MSRQGETVSLRITLRYRNLDEFVVRYAENVSSAGLFIRTRAPKPAGTRIRFELLLADGERALRGEGVVVGARHDDKPGMAIRFNALEPSSEALVERIVESHGQGRLAPTPLATSFDKERGRRGLQTSWSSLSGAGPGSSGWRGSTSAGWVPLGGRPALSGRGGTTPTTSGLLPRTPSRGLSSGAPPGGDVRPPESARAPEPSAFEKVKRPLPPSRASGLRPWAAGQGESAPTQGSTIAETPAPSEKAPSDEVIAAALEVDGRAADASAQTEAPSGEVIAAALEVDGRAADVSAQTEAPSDEVIAAALEVDASATDAPNEVIAAALEVDASATDAPNEAGPLLGSGSFDAGRSASEAETGQVSAEASAARDPAGVAEADGLSEALGAQIDEALLAQARWAAAVDTEPTVEGDLTAWPELAQGIETVGPELVEAEIALNALAELGPRSSARHEPSFHAADEASALLTDRDEDATPATDPSPERDLGGGEPTQDLDTSDPSTIDETPARLETAESPVGGEPEPSVGALHREELGEEPSPPPVETVFDPQERGSEPATGSQRDEPSLSGLEPSESLNSGMSWAELVRSAAPARTVGGFKSAPKREAPEDNDPLNGAAWSGPPPTAAGPAAPLGDPAPPGGQPDGAGSAFLGDRALGSGDADSEPPLTGIESLHPYEDPHEAATTDDADPQPPATAFESLHPFEEPHEATTDDANSQPPATAFKGARPLDDLHAATTDDADSEPASSTMERPAPSVDNPAPGSDAYVEAAAPATERSAADGPGSESGAYVEAAAPATERSAADGPGSESGAYVEAAAPATERFAADGPGSESGADAETAAPAVERPSADDPGPGTDTYAELTPQDPGRPSVDDQEPEPDAYAELTPPDPGRPSVDDQEPKPDAYAELTPPDPGRLFVDHPGPEVDAHVEAAALAVEPPPVDHPGPEVDAHVEAAALAVEPPSVDHPGPEPHAYAEQTPQDPDRLSVGHPGPEPDAYAEPPRNPDRPSVGHPGPEPHAYVEAAAPAVEHPSVDDPGLGTDAYAELTPQDPERPSVNDPGPEPDAHVEAAALAVGRPSADDPGLGTDAYAELTPQDPERPSVDDPGPRPEADPSEPPPPGLERPSVAVAEPERARSTGEASYRDPYDPPTAAIEVGPSREPPEPTPRPVDLSGSAPPEPAVGPVADRDLGVAAAELERPSPDGGDVLQVVSGSLLDPITEVVPRMPERAARERRDSGPAVRVTGLSPGEARMPATASRAVSASRGAVQEVAFSVRSRPSGPRRPLGLDFGLESIRLGYMEAGELRLVPLKGSPQLPAWVAADPSGHLIVGHEARAVAREEPSRAVAPLALLHALPRAKLGEAILGIRLEEDDAGRMIITLGDRRFDAADVLVTFLRTVRSAYVEHFGHDHVRLMISVAPDIDDYAAAALRSACREADIEVFRLDGEPDALLRAYHLVDQAIEAAVTVDVGTSRLTLALARRGTSGLRVVAVRYALRWTARALDERIADIALARHSEATGEDLRGDPDVREEVVSAVESLRPELRRSTTLELRVRLPLRSWARAESPFDHGMVTGERVASAGEAEGTAGKPDAPDSPRPRADTEAAGAPGAMDGRPERVLRVPRAMIEEETQDLVAELCKEVQALLKEESASPLEVGAIVLAGAAGGFPPIAEALGSLFGREPLTAVPPQQALLLGLARGGVALERRESASRPDALSASIGVELPGGRFRPLIHAGTHLPVELVRQFPTTRAGQTELELRLYQGEGEVVRLCSALGTLRLEGLPKRSRGALTVELLLSVDREGVLQAQLREPTSGRAGRLEVPTQQTPPARRRMIAETPELPDNPDPEPPPPPKRSLFRRWFGG